DRLARPGVGDPTLDHETADERDVGPDRGDPWRVGQAKAGVEVRLTLGRGEGHGVARAALGVAEQFVAAVLLPARPVRCVEPTDLDARDELAGLFVAGYTPDRTRRTRRMLAPP